MEHSKRDLVIDNTHYAVVIGLRTHLGCIPAWKKDEWKYACHGEIFNYNGKMYLVLLLDY